MLRTRPGYAISPSSPHTPRRLDSERRRVPALVLLFLYLSVHFATVSIHPFVHSDEVWLAGLSRAMMVEGTPAAVEEFFRLTPRHPHSLKTLYHLVQMPFLAVRWSVVSVRLPSLIAGLISLLLMAGIAGNAGLGRSYRILPSIFMALDPQFWYLAHLARQEMVVIALFLASWYFKGRRRSPYAAALPLAAAVFVHPNAFLFALPLGMFYLMDLRPDGGRSNRDDGSGKPWLDLLIFSSVPALAAGLAWVLSRTMDPDFLVHYRQFGDTVGVGDSWLVKILGLPDFLAKMARRQSGTYYLADVRPFFAAGVLGFIGLTAYPPIRKPRELIVSLPTLLLGMTIIGKYGPPTIGFLMPPAYLCFGIFVGGTLSPSDHPEGDGPRTPNARLRQAVRWMAIGLAGLLLSVSTVMTVSELRGSIDSPSYREYRQFLVHSVGNEGRVLMNLNGGFAFGYDRIAIWRDLASLPAEEGALEVFLEQQDIRWIVVSDELEFIHSRRPVWNAVYGNPRWYPELAEILNRRGILVAEAVIPNYAMRIVPFMDRGDWRLQVFRID